MNYNTPNLPGFTGNPSWFWPIYSAIRWISRRLNSRKISDETPPAKPDPAMSAISFDQLSSFKDQMTQTPPPGPSTSE